MQRRSRFVGSILMVAAGSIVLAAASPDLGYMFHERKEVAGLAVVFGAEPEPALTEEMQSLVWRVSSLSDDEPYTEMKSVQVRITYDGEEFGPYTVRGVRGSEGRYQTKRIFVAAGSYTSVLSFKKGDEDEVHTVDFDFNITDRSEMEIPRRRGGR
jgi:hypothetical protein